MQAVVQASAFDRPGMLRRLLELGADANATTTPFATTPLMSAVSSGAEQCVAVLLATPGIELDKQDHVSHVRGETRQRRPETRRAVAGPVGALSGRRQPCCNVDGSFSTSRRRRARPPFTAPT